MDTELSAHKSLQDISKNILPLTPPEQIDFEELFHLGAFDRDSKWPKVYALISSNITKMAFANSRFWSEAIQSATDPITREEAKALFFNSLEQSDFLQNVVVGIFHHKYDVENVQEDKEVQLFFEQIHNLHYSRLVDFHIDVVAYSAWLKKRII